VKVQRAYENPFYPVCHLDTLARSAQSYTRDESRGNGQKTMTSETVSGFDPPFLLDVPPNGPSPVLFNSPHSGSDYPQSLLDASRLDPLELRRSEDVDVDILFGGVVDCGGSLMRVKFPRAYVDVNREPYELDPKMFSGRLPLFANTRSLRVASGLGTIPRTVGEGHDIYRISPTVDEALERIEALYKPYHRALARALLTAQRRHGLAVLVDCHSMPSAAVSRGDGMKCDFVIGDRFGTSADPAIPDGIEASLTAMGYSVARNRPYAGGFITEHYGNPYLGVHAVQIEINRGLYLDERRMTRLHGFDGLREDLIRMTADLIALVSADLLPYNLAAE
jgi:N-formylglutamate amidohydrolase